VGASRNNPPVLDNSFQTSVLVFPFNSFSWVIVFMKCAQTVANLARHGKRGLLLADLMNSLESWSLNQHKGRLRTSFQSSLFVWLDP